ncbi:acyltransferase family protein [Samsonia erythrinae]|uniref:acyltransferase family protein n=1 Tax=Samsonia erythrinae TaxID=160434 RepID=UPI002E786FDD|nr:acyltransferase [Samsonia erythrinae]
MTGIISINHVHIWLPNLLLIQTWIPHEENYIGGNTPSWFISVIVFFYIIFPFIFKLIKNINTNYLWMSLLLCYIAIIAIDSAIYTLLPSVPLIEGWPFMVGEIQFWLAYTFPPARVFEFIIGMLLSRIILEGRWISVSVTTSVTLLVLAYCLDLFMPFLLSLKLVALIPLTLLIGSLAVNDLREKHSFLHSKPMQWLGNISFGFYMIHFFILKILAAWTDGARYDTMSAILLIVLAGVVSLVASWLLYTFIEKPIGHFLTAKKNKTSATQESSLKTQ